MKRPAVICLTVALCAASYLAGRWHEARSGGGDQPPPGKARTVSRASLPPVRMKAAETPPGGGLSSVLPPATPEEEAKGPVERVRDALAEPNEFRRLQLFWRALTHLKPEDARGIQDLFDQGDLEGRHYGAEYQYFARRWGEVDGAAAVAHGVKAWQNRGGMDGMLSRMADGWASQEPQAAVDWINDHGNEKKWMVDAVMEGLINGLAETDLDRAREFVESRAGEPGAEGSFQQLADKYIYLKSIGDAESWFSTLDKGKARESLTGHLTDRYLRAGPEQAAAFLDRHREDIDEWSAVTVAAAWQRTDPARAKQWISTLPDQARAAFDLPSGGKSP